MKPAPITLGLIHFIGIGGIGMSGIARILHTMGYYVQGSDCTQNFQTQQLEQLGVRIFTTHAPENLQKVKMVVVSSAIREDNPELIEARMRRIPIIRRAEMLGELMRLRNSISISGTHGKTTTTSIVGALLDKAGYDPTIVSGGIINAYGSNARAGKGQWIVVEADESDGSFKYLPGTLSVLTNIDPEHLDYYSSFENLKKACEEFILSIPFYGLAVLCWDHPVVRAFAERITDRRVRTYGLEEGADIQAVDLQMFPDHTQFNLKVRSKYLTPQWRKDLALEEKEEEEAWTCIQGFSFALVGQHNVQNALVAIVVALELDLSLQVVQEALRSFGGVKRRFTLAGEFKGTKIIDDYAHHPTEIEAVLRTARQLRRQGQIIAVWQPHRYSRVQNFLEEFCEVLQEADHIFVLPIYGAGELPLSHMDLQFLEAALQTYGNTPISTAGGVLELAEKLYSVIEQEDMVLCLGAGDITHYAYQLPEAFMELDRTFLRRLA